MNIETMSWVVWALMLILGLGLAAFIVWVVVKLLQYWSVI